MKKRFTPLKKLDTRMNLRVNKFETGKRFFFSRSKTGVQSSSNQVTEELEQQQGVENAQSASVVKEKTTEPILNNDVWRTRIYKRGVRKWRAIVNRAWRGVAFVLKVWSRKDVPIGTRIEQIVTRRELNAIELMEIMDAQQRKRLNAKHKADAKIAEQIIINTLTNLGYAHKPEGKGKTSRIRFDVAKWDEHSYRYHVDASKLPFRVDLPELATPRVTTTLAGALGRPVSAILGNLSEVKLSGASVYDGLWFEVEIAGTLGIPNHCEFWKMVEQIENSAHPLAFSLGYAESKRHIVRSLEPLPHLLIAGETLGGKSNGLNVVICCHISRNTPDTVRTLMLDVKGGGIELGHYEGIQHMILEVPDVPNGIARTSEQGLKVFQWVAAESAARMAEFTAHKLKKISQWNKKYPRRRKPYIVVYVDEMSELLDPGDKKLRNAILSIIRKLASTARAAGVHLIGALQTADRTNMPQTIKNNFPGRLAFAMADTPASILAIGNGAATDLSPVGRAIWKHGRDRVTVQTPFISNGDIEQIVENAKLGKTTKRIQRSKVSPEEVIRWALDENEGRLRVSEVFSNFRERMPRSEIELLLYEMEKNTYELDDVNYKIIKGIGTRPRTVQILHDGDAVTAFSRDRTQDTSENVTRDELVTEEK